MRKLITFFLAMICISVGFSVESMAQSIIISKDGINQEADTLNFGARAENNPKVDSFLVVNNTKDTLYIPNDPLYLNRVNAFPFDDTFAEFELDTIQQRTRPFIILPQSTFAIKVNFKVDTADKGAGFNADQSLKRARIFINLCKIGDTSTIVASDTIYLFGDRTTKFMKPSDSVIVFDTMYIGATKKGTLTVYNGTDSKTLNLDIKQNNMSNVNIRPSDIGSFTLAPNEKREIPIEYTVRTLADSLVKNALTITSKPGSKSQSEVSNIDLKTFVAFQKFEIDEVTTTTINVSGLTYTSSTSLTLTDTIDVGSSSKIFQIAIKNIGNVPATIDSVNMDGTMKDNFIVDKNASPRVVQPNSSTSFFIRFIPKLNGPIQSNVIVNTNFSSQFPNLSPNEDKHVFSVTGYGASGALVVDNGIQTCDTVLFSELNSDCLTPCANTYTLTASGSRGVMVEKIVFNGDQSAFIFDPPLNSRITINEIKPGVFEKKAFVVIYNPGKREGVFKGKLSFITLSDTQSREFSYFSATPQASIAPDTVFVSPGDELRIPLVVKIPLVSIKQASYFKLNFSLPKESLKSLRITSLELNLDDINKKKYDISDTFNADKEQIIDISPNDPKGAFKSDTIAFINAKYFLSEYPESIISIDTFKLGSVPGQFPCDMFKVGLLPKIIIKAKDNSFCADQETLESFFADIRSKKISFTAMMPMSGESVVEIQHFIPESLQADISLYAVTGEKVETIFSGIAPTELTKRRHPLTNLPRGVYYCELRAGAFRKTIPIVITQ